MLIRKLFRTAWRYKAQFISMIVMIAIGVGVWVGFNMEWKTIEADTAAFFEETKFADYRVYKPLGFSAKDVEKLRAIDGVDAATRFLQVNVDIPDTKKSLALCVSEDYNVSTMVLMEGEEYDPDSLGIWLSDRYAEENGVALGDTITMSYQKRTVEGEVVGLVKAGEMLICVADENQLMPDYESFGFAYISPAKLRDVLGFDFYPQVNLISALEKEELEEAIRENLGVTLQVVPKELQVSYQESRGEMEEGKTMAAVLPVLFLVIAVLTMVTTMSRIAANEKVQIGTLKALGFRDRRITRHYTAYGFMIGLLGSALGVALGFGICYMIMNPNGMMGTYFDMPSWDMTVPGFVWPYLAGMLVILTLISRLSVKRMLTGSAAEALRPYVPKNVRRSALEKLRLWDRFSFGVKWNLRDILRHKARSFMTLFGVFGCMLLLVGSFGMNDTMNEFLRLLRENNQYATRINLTENADEDEALALAAAVDGDWEADAGISYDGRTVVLSVYELSHELMGFVNEQNETISFGDDGAYLCLRLRDTAQIGDTITFSPYGSEEEYEVRVAGYYRSVMSEGIAMTAAYAEKAGVPYALSSIVTQTAQEDIPVSAIVSGTQDFDTLMETYDSFMEIMVAMVALLAAAAVVLGIVVLYNLGVMSYVERYTELATLKVLGFRNKRIGRLLIGQNIWLTVLGALVGLPCGVAVLQYLIDALAGEYEMFLHITGFTVVFSLGLTLLVSLFVGWMVARKNRKIDMVAALKGAE